MLINQKSNLMKTLASNLTQVIYFFVFLCFFFCFFYIALKLPQWIDAFDNFLLVNQMPDIENIAGN